MIHPVAPVIDKNAYCRHLRGRAVPERRRGRCPIRTEKRRMERCARWKREGHTHHAFDSVRRGMVLMVCAGRIGVSSFIGLFRFPANRAA